ncbi:tryptophan--tRNA ligase [Thermomicrobiaceae bacterium CFH 74404]|uniref:Tryptophan--tRNA ligase n=1 Tax=Thermalbibacter longus TaxID=2951981 RepID=A0AA42BAF2_9BACT|nr:tryptophan--tRNA ligase [Thermalbibacter longus]MCM8749642.1 tryptophan--tRNA ligase [Thermalbibacter longus]
MTGKPRAFSGIQPTGGIHIGNYLGAIRNWVLQQDQYDNMFCIVDLHAMTLPYDASELRPRTVEVASALLAAGIDPQRSILFVQSDVREHTELCWILGTLATYGELRRMTQFKEKSKGSERVGAGVFFYPVLQAADILLYDAAVVPVGEDQKQHIELTRDLAMRFNRTFGETFVVPEPDIKPAGARIMSLTDPLKKMSKSDPDPESRIELRDPPDVIRRKIRRAVTDSEAEVRFDEERKPAISNLLTIYSLFADVPIPELERRYAGKGYSEFKRDLAEVVIAGLQPIQQRLDELAADPGIVIRTLRGGAARARELAVAKMAVVRDRCGLGLPPLD